jgi:hypothetical protein
METCKRQGQILQIFAAKSLKLGSLKIIITNDLRKVPTYWKITPFSFRTTGEAFSNLSPAKIIYYIISYPSLLEWHEN